MVKPVWVAVAFAAGIAVGVVLLRSKDPVALPPIVAGEGAEDHASTVAATAPSPAVPAFGATRSVATSQPNTAVAIPVQPQAPAPDDQAEYTGYSQPIDVGPVFRRTMEATPVAGTTNSLAVAHRELEREVRDDNWSYPLEAEIQNSLVVEASSGNFTVQHVECRATLCEIRLSAKGEQAAALSRWSDSVHTLPWGARLAPNVTSMISENGQVEQLLILRKRPR